ncbi:hypothetical protein niasHS_008131 [Heterodera schachtii]|uniref:Uncharacterized protein n=1 Tax=Heterodera schachtii TaxID=97005 RepID=A0ABD2J1U3_HETSC
MSACLTGLKAEELFVRACPPIFGPFCILGCPSACMPFLPTFPAWALCMSACIGQPPPVWACNEGGLHAPSDEQNCYGEEFVGLGPSAGLANVENAQFVQLSTGGFLSDIYRIQIQFKQVENAKQGGTTPTAFSCIFKVPTSRVWI